MRINIDRLCELAGVPGAKRTRGGLMSEGMRVREGEPGDGGNVREGEDDGGKVREGDMPNQLATALDEMEGPEQDEGAEPEAQHEMADDPNEVLDINEADLVKELRRMRVKMHEARKIEQRRQQNLQEAQLKAIIDQEVKNVIKELNLNSGWVYGQKKPTRSRKGYTHQGSFLKGLGFK
jgi:hypothetical protein